MAFTIVIFSTIEKHDKSVKSHTSTFGGRDWLHQSTGTSGFFERVKFGLASIAA